MSTLEMQKMQLQSQVTYLQTNAIQKDGLIANLQSEIKNLARQIQIQKSKESLQDETLQNELHQTAKRCAYYKQKSKFEQGENETLSKEIQRLTGRLQR